MSAIAEPIALATAEAAVPGKTAEPTVPSGVKPGKSAEELAQSVIQQLTAKPTESPGQEPSPGESKPVEAPPAPGSDDAADSNPPPTDGAEEAETDTKAWPESARHRVDKLTSQKTVLTQRAETAEAKSAEIETRAKELETELNRLREQLEVTPVTPAPPDSPLAKITNESELAATSRETKQVLRDIERFDRNAMRPEERAKFETWLKGLGLWNESEAAADTSALAFLKFRLEDVLTEHVPARARFIQEERAYNTASEQVLPWLKDKTHEDTLGVERILRRYPAIRQLPNWKIVAAAQWLGEKQLLPLLQQRAVANGNGHPAPPVPANPAPRKPSPTAPRVAVPGPAPRTESDSAMQIAALRAKANGPEATEADVVAYTEALLRAPR